MQLHPPLIFARANATLPTISNSRGTLPLCHLCRRLPTPCRSSCCRCDAAGGPPPLQSYPNSCGATHCLAPQSFASWARDDVQLLSLLPPLGLTPMFVCALLSSLLLQRQPPSCRRSQGHRPGDCCQCPSSLLCRDLAIPRKQTRFSPLLWWRRRADRRCRCCRCSNHCPPRPILRLIVVLASSLPLRSTSLLSLPSALANLPIRAVEGGDKDDASTAIALASLQHCRGVVDGRGKQARQFCHHCCHCISCF